MIETAARIEIAKYICTEGGWLHEAYQSTRFFSSESQTAYLSSEISLPSSSAHVLLYSDCQRSLGLQLEASQELPALEFLRNTTLERRRKVLLGAVVVGTVTQETEIFG